MGVKRRGVTTYLVFVNAKKAMEWAKELLIQRASYDVSAQIEAVTFADGSDKPGVMFGDVSIRWNGTDAHQLQVYFADKNNRRLSRIVAGCEAKSQATDSECSAIRRGSSFGIPAQVRFSSLPSGPRVYCTAQNVPDPLYTQTHLDTCAISLECVVLYLCVVVQLCVCVIDAVCWFCLLDMIIEGIYTQPVRAAGDSLKSLYP